MEIEISLKDIAEGLRRGIFVIIAMALVFGCAFFAYSKYVMEPVYKTSIKFTSSSADASSERISIYQTIAPQHIEYLNVSEFYQKVSEKILNSGEQFYSEEEVANAVRFSGVVEETATFYVTVQSGDPDKTYTIVSAIVDCAPERINEMKPGDLLVVVSKPYYPSSPSSPNIMRNALIGFFSGLILACVTIILKETLDTRLKSTSEISEIYKLPVLGTVPDFSGSEAVNGGR